MALAQFLLTFVSPYLTPSKKYIRISIWKMKIRDVHVLNLIMIILAEWYIWRPRKMSISLDMQFNVRENRKRHYFAAIKMIINLLTCTSSFLILITPIELWMEENSVTVKHLHEMIRWTHIDQETSVSWISRNILYL